MIIIMMIMILQVLSDNNYLPGAHPSDLRHSGHGPLGGSCEAWKRLPQVQMFYTIRHKSSILSDGRLELLEGVSHWVQEEAPEKVNSLISNFLDQ